MINLSRINSIEEIQILLKNPFLDIKTKRILSNMLLMSTQGIGEGLEFEE